MAINVKIDFGAVGNGINNDSIPIQNAINSIINPFIPDNGGEIFFPEGNYLIEDLLIINQGRDIKLYLEKNAKLFTNKHGHGILEISNSKNICIQGGKFFGSGNFPDKDYGNTHGGGEKFFTGIQGVAWGHHRNRTTQIAPSLPPYNNGFMGSCGIGILIRNGSTGIKISHTNIQNFNYTGVQVQFLGDTQVIQKNYCQNITVESCNIQNIYSAGIGIHSAYDTIITNNHIFNIGHTDANGTEPIINPGYGVTARGIRDLGTEAKNLLIVNNTFSKCRSSGIDSHASVGIIVNSNTIDQAFMRGISLTGSQGERKSSILSNNLIINSANVIGGTGIPNNPDFPGVPKVGIVNNYPNTIISNNHLKDSGIDYAIYNTGSYTLIEGNNIVYETTGILGDDSQSGRVICCPINNSSLPKIRNMSIVNNTIKGGSILSAIYLKNVEKSKVQGNDIELSDSNELLKMINCIDVEIGENSWGDIVFNNENTGRMMPEKLTFTVEWVTPQTNNDPHVIVTYINNNNSILSGDAGGAQGQVIKFISGSNNPSINDASKQMIMKLSYINKIGASYVALKPDFNGSQLWCHISPKDNSNNLIFSNNPIIVGLKIYVEIDLIFQV